MRVYINSASCISPQNTFDENCFANHLVTYNGNRLQCIEPDYSAFIDAKQIRRMSKVVKMGVATSLQCLSESGVSMPDAIITGTGLGCLCDTDLFITKLVEHNEDMLNPTAFIHSTHNTISSQVALMLQCRNYNSTYVHRNLSFESALLDAMLLINEQSAGNVLVGGNDELIETSYNLLSRLGWFKTEIENNVPLYNSATGGTIAGEGAAYFILSNEHKSNSLCELKTLQTFFSLNSEEVEIKVEHLLQQQQMKLHDIDLFITAHNGDCSQDRISDLITSALKLNRCELRYKHLCGEYLTSSSFALWLAANVIKQEKLPQFLNEGLSIVPKNILIHNHFRNANHAFILLSAC